MSAILRQKYSFVNLFAVIGTTYGGDGVSTFSVPDLREAVPVGVGSSNRAAYQHDVYTLGQFKDDQFQQHAHNVYVRDTGHTHKYTGVYANVNDPTGTLCSAYVNPTAVATEFAYAQIQVNSSPYYDGTANSTNNAGTTGGTHGKRLGMNYIIKY